jgi:hypothetical protein
MSEDPEITEAKQKLQAEILEYQNIATFLNTTFSGELSSEDQIKFSALKQRAEDLTGLNRDADIIEIVAKLKKLVENKQALLDPFSECKL